MLYRKRRGAINGRTVPHRSVTGSAAGGGTRTRALVTGGSGSLGQVLVEHLLDNDYEVHSLDLRIPEKEDRDPHVSSYIQADVTNLEDLIVAFKGMDVVFHAAGLLPHLSVSKADMYSVNLTGTENVVTACIENGVKRLIYTSTYEVVLTKKGVYSDPSGVTPPNSKHPLNPYAGSKALAEEAVCKANGVEGLVTCALRPGVILAADNHATQLHSRRLCYYDDGRDHIHVVPILAVASAHLLAEQKLRQDGCSSVAAGKAYFIAGVRVPFREFVGKMDGNTTIWRQPPPIWVPVALLHIAAYINVAVYALLGISPFGEVGMVLSPANLSMLVDHNCDSTPACKELGWDMNFPAWEDMVKETVEEMYGDQ